MDSTLQRVAPDWLRPPFENGTGASQNRLALSRRPPEKRRALPDHSPRLLFLRPGAADELYGVPLVGNDDDGEVSARRWTTRPAVKFHAGGRAANNSRHRRRVIGQIRRKKLRPCLQGARFLWCRLPACKGQSRRAGTAPQIRPLPTDGPVPSACGAMPRGQSHFCSATPSQLVSKNWGSPRLSRLRFGLARGAVTSGLPENAVPGGAF